MNTTGLNNLETFSRGQTEPDFCEKCLAEVKTLQNKVDFLVTLLRKNKIPIPDRPYDQKQHGYSDLVVEANKIIDDLKSRIAKFEK